MKDLTSIAQFEELSTWGLLGLGIVTYGVYLAYYIKKQTVKINDLTDVTERISTSLVNTILFISYLSLALFFPYLMVEEGHPVELMGDVVDSVWMIMVIIWGFKARNRVNKVYEFSKDDDQWFSGLWTFLVTPLYFNYKINCICEDYIKQTASVES